MKEKRVNELYGLISKKVSYSYCNLYGAHNMDSFVGLARTLLWNNLYFSVRFQLSVGVLHAFINCACAL